MNKISGALLVTLFAVTVVFSQEDPVKWSASSSVAAVHPGQKFTAKVSAKIERGWHIYSITQGPGGPVPTEITVAPKQPFALSGFVIGPLPKSAYDANFQIETDTYELAAAFTVPVITATNAPPGKSAVAIDVHFMACDERTCLPAKTVHLSAPVRVSSGH